MRAILHATACLTTEGNTWRKNTQEWSLGAESKPRPMPEQMRKWALQPQELNSTNNQVTLGAVSPPEPPGENLALPIPRFWPRKTPGGKPNPTCWISDSWNCEPINECCFTRLSLWSTEIENQQTYHKTNKNFILFTVLLCLMQKSTSLYISDA